MSDSMPLKAKLKEKFGEEFAGKIEKAGNFKSRTTVSEEILLLKGKDCFDSTKLSLDLQEGREVHKA